MSKTLAIIVVLFAAACIYSQDANDLNKRGVKSFERGDYDSAIAYFTRAIELSSRLAARPSDAVRKNFLENDSTTLDAEQVTVLDPLTAIAYTGRGKAYFAKGDFEKAVSDYDHALTITPSMTAALLCRGIARFGMQQLDLALADFERVITFNKNQIGGYIGRGAVRQAQGDLTAAIDDFNTAIKLEPKNPMAYYYRGESRRRSGRFNGSIEGFRIFDNA